MQHANDTLKARTFSILCDKMTHYGNNLGDIHKDALRTLTTGLVSLATGATRGRYAYPLNCGLGKTQSVIALCEALHELKRDDISVAVAASKVEALCEVKRDMLLAGIPESRVGLLHSYGDKASLPATEDNDSRPFLLCTHNRIKGNGPVARFNTYRGQPRSLIVWDESLLVSDARALSYVQLKAALGYASAYLKDSAAVAYLDHALSLLGAELQRQKDTGVGTARPVQLPEIDGETIAKFKRELTPSTVIDIAEPLRSLLEMATQPLRAVYTTGRESSGLISYDIAVPPELENIAILDASYPIRELERLDRTIKPGMVVNPALKLHGNVTVYHASARSGRSAMSEDFTGEKSVSAEICAAVKTIPVNEGVIIWTFKPKRSHSGRSTKRTLIDFAAILQDDMKEAGIDIHAKVIDKQGVQRNRFVWLTWGQETSTSEHGYCSNALFAGILHRNLLDIASYLAGQRDDLWATVEHREVRAVLASEVAHGVYQAICRGSCRFVEGNQARAMKVWLFHKDASLKDALMEVMPQLQWEPWAVRHIGTGIRRKLIGAIEAFFATLSPDVARISVSQIRKAMGATEAARDTFRLALTDYLKETTDWVREGRSVIRETFGFTSTEAQQQ